MGYWDAQGNVVAEYTYDAFGKLIASSGPMADVFSFRYSTKYFDPETGFYYYGYRYYSPELMRWITRDPIGEEGGVNLYAMCGNSITWQIDYLGLIDVFWREPTATESSKISAAVREIVEISDLYLRRIAIFRERYFPQVVNYPRNVWFVPRERDRSADLSYLPYALKEGFHLEEHRDRGTLNMALLQIENRLKKEKEILNFTGFRVQTCRNVWCRLWGALAYRQLSIIGFCNRAFESDDYEFQNIVAHEASHMFHSTQDYYSTQDIDKCLSDAYAWGILYEARPAPPPHW
jgi:RHS repeat-associated protein